MNYRNSKSQAPSSKEAANGKFQTGDFEAAWRLLEEADGDGSIILREEPATSIRQPMDLAERTARFGALIIHFAKEVPQNPTNNRLIDQIVGAGTSVGANYCEAYESVSKRDFKFIISRCLKEVKETKFFIRMVVASEPQLAERARPLYREAHELLLIFAAIRRKS
jgi:four helix bundle protein